MKYAIKLVKTITKKTTIPALVSLVLTSGCLDFKPIGTPGTSFENSGGSRIRTIIPNQNPQSLEEIMSAKEEFEISQRYWGQLEDIRETMKSRGESKYSKDYDPHQDIHTLYRNVLRSNLKEKDPLLDAIKGFTYRQEEEKSQAHWRNNPLTGFGYILHKFKVTVYDVNAFSGKKKKVRSYRYHTKRTNSGVFYDSRN